MKINNTIPMEILEIKDQKLKKEASVLIAIYPDDQAAAAKKPELMIKWFSWKDAEYPFTDAALALKSFRQIVIEKITESKKDSSGREMNGWAGCSITE